MRLGVVVCTGVRAGRPAGLIRSHPFILGYPADMRRWQG